MRFLILLLPVFVQAWTRPAEQGWRAALLLDQTTDKICDESFIDENVSKHANVVKECASSDFPKFNIRDTRKGSYDFPFGLQFGTEKPEAFNMRLFAYFYPEKEGTYKFKINADSMAKIWSGRHGYVNEKCVRKRDSLDVRLTEIWQDLAVFTDTKNSRCWNGGSFNVTVKHKQHYIPIQIFYVNRKFPLTLTLGSGSYNAANFELKITDGNDQEVQGKLYYKLQQC